MLDAVRQALLAGARADADAELAASAAWVQQQREDARRRAAERVAASDAAARADADMQLAIARANARREARRLVLEAQSEVRRELVRRARDEVRSLRDDPGYEVLVQHLDDLARSQLGPDADVVVDDERGGVLAMAAGRRVDYTLPGLVERCIDRLGPEVDRLWR